MVIRIVKCAGARERQVFSAPPFERPASTCPRRLTLLPAGADQVHLELPGLASRLHGRNDVFAPSCASGPGPAGIGAAEPSKRVLARIVARSRSAGGVYRESSRPSFSLHCFAAASMSLTGQSNTDAARRWRLDLTSPPSSLHEVDPAATTGRSGAGRACRSAGANGVDPRIGNSARRRLGRPERCGRRAPAC